MLAEVMWSKDIWLVALDVILELLNETTEAQCEHIMDEVERRRLTGRRP